MPLRGLHRDDGRAALALPALPSLVAVSVAEPAALLVTRPLGLTVATAVLLLAHFTGRPVLPAGAAGEATSLAQAPTTTAAAPSSVRVRNRDTRRDNLKR